ncbi:MAG: PAS domain S-box protein [Sciscionella sp.]
MDASEAARIGARATVTVDRDGIIRQWGGAVTELVGHSAEDALGRSLDVVIPPVFRPLHWWGFDRAMKSGRMSGGTLKLPALCKDGRIVVAHTAIELIPARGRGADGAVVTFVGVGGGAWQGKAWQAALAPINLARRMGQRIRAARR